MFVLVAMVVSGHALAEPNGTTSATSRESAEQPQLLTDEEIDLLQEGEITEARLGSSVAANLFVGFGLGQAIQGRWGETGWIFTFGMGFSTVLLYSGLSDQIDCGSANACQRDQIRRDRGLIYGGGIALAAFYVAGIVEAYVGAHIHNRDMRELRKRLGTPMHARIIPYVKKSPDGGGTAGLTFRF